MLITECTLYIFKCLCKQNTSLYIEYQFNIYTRHNIKSTGSGQKCCCGFKAVFHHVDYNNIFQQTQDKSSQR